jgi:hypothetical protein
MAVKTQGTELYLADPSDGSPFDVVKFGCPTGITGLGGPADQIETTCLGATEKSYVQGLFTPGQVSVPFNLDPANASHQLLFDLKDLGDNLNWIICLSDGDDVPVLNSDDDFVAPADRTSFKFVAYIADINIDVATNEIVRGTLTLQRSGSVVATWKP